MKQYLMYLRKSRTDRDYAVEDTLHTLSRHEKILTDFATRNHYSIAAIYREVVSGESIALRPEIQRVLSLLETGEYAGVLVMDIDRLARGNTIDQGIISQTFQYTGTQIITPDRTYDPGNDLDQEYFEFSLFMGRKEYDLIKKRLTRGRLQSVREGKFCGSVPPFGYLRQKLPSEKGYTLQIHPLQSMVVQSIFSWYASTLSGLSMQQIADRLNAEQIPTQHGQLWTSSSVSSILHNPVYAGLIRWNYRRTDKSLQNGHITRSRPIHEKDVILVPGRHEAIISSELFQQVQERLQHNNHHRTQIADTASSCATAPMNPLVGLLRCSCCGRWMIRRPTYRGSRKPILVCPTAGCPNSSCSLEALEQVLLSKLSSYIKSLDSSQYSLNRNTFQQFYQNDLSQNQTAQKRQLSYHEKQLVIYQQALNHLHDLLEEQIYDSTLFLTRQATLMERIAQEQQVISTLQTQIASTHSNANLIHFPDSIEAFYTRMNCHEKNQFLKLLLVQADYDRTSEDHIVRLRMYPRI